MARLRVLIGFVILNGLISVPLPAENSDPAAAGNAENRFVFAQLRHSADWDPYPSVWEQVAAFLVQTTSVNPWPARRVVTMDDPRLFESPFLVVAGRGAVSFSENETAKLRDYVLGGGTVFVDNSEAERSGPFSRSILPALERAFPGARWEDLPTSHAVYRSFFLLRSSSGRRQIDPRIKALVIQDRAAVLFCANDLMGAWARDPLGNYLYGCEPGGERQRTDSFKLLADIILFSLTGTYKTDAIHQPFIERKIEP